MGQLGCKLSSSMKDVMTKKEERQGYLSEADLYVLWILSDAKMLLGKSRIDFGNPTALGSREMLTVFIVRNLSRAFGFELKGFELVRGKFAFDGFCASEYQKNKEFCEQKPESPIAKALTKIHDGHFDFSDVESASLRAKSYFEFIESSPNL